MIRATVPEDTPRLLEIAERTGVFRAIEVSALGEVLEDYFRANHAQGHQAVTAAVGDDIRGFAYFAPAAMTDRTWYVYWIAVDPGAQKGGVGRRLVDHMEQAIGRANGRQLLIETSSLSHYEPTRRFYLRRGYDEVASIPDYYADGDHMVVFRKRLAPG